MSKQNEANATLHDKQEELTSQRPKRQRRHRILATLACMVVLVTAVVLMTPAISMTLDVANETPGVVLEGQTASDEAASSEAAAAADDTASDEASSSAAAEAADAAADADSDEASEAASASDDQASDAASKEAASDDDAASDAASAADDEASDDASADANSDDEAASSEAAAKKAAEEPAGPASSVGTIDPESDSDMPAQTFSVDLKNSDGEVVMTVAVDAPEGAFPAGTFMKVDGVRAQSDLEEVQAKVEEAVKDANGPKTKVKEFTAVDITFLDSDDNEIEPAKKVEVKITSDTVDAYDDPVLVHVLDKSKKSSKGKTDDAEVISGVKIVKGEDSAVEDTMKFESKAFSPYVIVDIADEATAGAAQTFEGEAEGVKVVVGAPEGAFPEGTTMEVTAVDPDEVADAVDAAIADDENIDQNASVQQIDAVAIAFYDEEGEAVEPEDSVKVSLTNANAPEEGESVVVDVDAEGNGTMVQQTMVTTANDKAIFEVDESATFAMVTLDSITGQFITADGKTVTVTVIYGEDAQIPENAKLEVSEVDADDEGWGDRSVRFAHTLSKEYGNVTISDARFLNIKLTADGEEIQPAAPVTMKVSYEDALVTEDMAEYAYDEEYGGEMRPDPDEQVSHFIAVQYDIYGQTVLTSETKEKGQTITESTATVEKISDCDIAYVYEYYAPEAK